MTSYRVPDTALPSQRALLTDRAVVTEHARALLDSFDDRVRHLNVAVDEAAAT